MDTTIEFKITLPVKLIKKTRPNVIVSYCQPLDLYSQGNDENEAIDNIKEAISSFLISCFERGVLDAVLKECGFSPVKPPKESVKEYNELVEIPVPLYLLNKNSRSPKKCHA